MEPGFGEAARKDPRVDDVLKVALRLEGLARNCSVHAAGVVISPQPLTELVPLYKTNRDEIVTQFDMNGLEKLGLLKMDFLGLTTLTLIQDALRLIQKRHGVEVVPEDLPLDDTGDLRDFRQGLHQRRVPVRIERHARHSAALPAEPHRRPDGAERALPAGADSGRHDRRFHRAQMGTARGAVRSSGIERAAGRNLRRHRVPGAGDADLQPPGRLFAGRGRRAAPRHGQEESRRDGQAARAFHPGRAGARVPAEEGREDFRPDGAVRGIRVQQVAFGGLCLPGLRDGVPEGALPGGLHGGAAHLGNREHGQGGEVHQRVPRDGDHDSAAGREPLGLELHARRAEPSASGWER